MKAKKKPIEGLTPEQLGVELAQQLVTLQVSALRTWLDLDVQHVPVCVHNKAVTLGAVRAAEGVCAICCVLQVEEPAKRKGGIMVSSVAELVEKLHKEAKVL
jgi:electron transfer flavoprotein alpha/beta subunit